MKIDQLTNPLESNASFQAKEFRIDDSPYAFQLLIKQLYKNPIQSIIREISSNAWDSHVQAKTEHPIKVLFPTMLEPYFSVEDWGTGLSPENMADLYTVLFRSNRRETNDYLGGYGLGAKSPFSYSDQFLVTSYYNGIEYQYAALINESGKPSLNLINTTPTERSNGVLIRLPVKEKDYYNFQYAGQNVLPWFPNVETNITLEKPVVLVDTPTFTITKKTARHNGGCYALINGVMYDVNFTIVYKNLDYSKRPNTTNWAGNLILKFNIGDLTIVPNREDLSYDDKTIEAISSAFNLARFNTQQIAQNRINLCYTYEEACKKYVNLYNVMDSFKWWSPEIHHPTRPKEHLSKYLRLQLPDFSMTRLERGRNVTKIISLVKDIKLDLTETYTVYWFPEKTRYLKEKIRDVNIGRYESTHLLVLGGERNEVETFLNNALLNPITLIDLNYKEYTPYRNTNKTWSGDLNTLLGDKLSTDYIHEDHYFVKINGDISKAKQIPLTKLRVINNVLNTQKRVHVGILPRHRWSLAKQYDWDDFENGALDQAYEIINKNVFAIQLQRALNKLPSQLAGFISHTSNPYNEITVLYEKTKHLQRKNSSVALDAAAIELDIKIPDNTNLEKELTHLYNRYKPLIDDHIRNTQIINAYEFYLEHKHA